MRRALWLGRGPGAARAALGLLQCGAACRQVWHTQGWPAHLLLGQQLQLQVVQVVQVVQLAVQLRPLRLRQLRRLPLRLRPRPTPQADGQAQPRHGGHHQLRALPHVLVHRQVQQPVGGAAAGRRAGGRGRLQDVQQRLLPLLLPLPGALRLAGGGGPGRRMLRRRAPVVGGGRAMLGACGGGAPGRQRGEQQVLPGVQQRHQTAQQRLEAVLGDPAPQLLHAAGAARLDRSRHQRLLQQPHLVARLLAGQHGHHGGQQRAPARGVDDQHVDAAWWVGMGWGAGAAGWGRRSAGMEAAASLRSDTHPAAARRAGG